MFTLALLVHRSLDINHVTVYILVPNTTQAICECTLGTFKEIIPLSAPHVYCSILRVLQWNYHQKSLKKNNIQIWHWILKCRPRNSKFYLTKAYLLYFFSHFSCDVNSITCKATEWIIHSSIRLIHFFISFHSHSQYSLKKKNWNEKFLALKLFVTSQV